MAMSPGVFLLGLADLQRKFLVQVGRSQLQMHSLFISTPIHVIWNYILVNKYELGVIGTGLAGLFTNLCSLVITIYQTNGLKELK